MEATVVVVGRARWVKGAARTLGRPCRVAACLEAKVPVVPSGAHTRVEGTSSPVGVAVRSPPAPLVEAPVAGLVHG